MSKMKKQNLDTFRNENRNFYRFEAAKMIAGAAAYGIGMVKNSLSLTMIGLAGFTLSWMEVVILESGHEYYYDD